MLSTDPKALWEELKRGAADAADIAARKTSELTNIAKLNVSIKSNESKLRNVYEEIGRLFYTAEREGVDYAEEIAACILKADQFKADIAAAKAQLAAQRNATICQSCGHEIDSSAFYCPFCGTSQNKADADEADEADETDKTDDAE